MTILEFISGAQTTNLFVWTFANVSI